ncbi:MAG: hypothetical protein SFZ03_00820 [Candidatus Melainabacteria bacterium]|nr:hypothetical protein [Candidatus Melainabacteria bacterium]
MVTAILSPQVVLPVLPKRTVASVRVALTHKPQPHGEKLYWERLSQQRWLNPSRGMWGSKKTRIQARRLFRDLLMGVLLLLPHLLS